MIRYALPSMASTWDSDLDSQYGARLRSPCPPDQGLSGDAPPRHSSEANEASDGDEDLAVAMLHADDRHPLPNCGLERSTH